MDDNYTTENLERVLNEFCAEYEELLKKKLLADGHKSTGKLLDSIKVEPKKSGSAIKVFLDSEKYLFWLNYGRKPGTYPPYDAIETWVKRKRITPEAYDLPDEKSLIFLMRGAIKKNGTLAQFGGDGKGGLYTQKVMDELYPKYEPKLQAAFKDDLDIYCAKIVNEIDRNLKI